MKLNRILALICITAMLSLCLSGCMGAGGTESTEATESENLQTVQ